MIETVWWRQVPNPQRLIRIISEYLLREESVILQVPAFVPWCEILYEELEEKIQAQNAQRSVRTFTADDVGDNLGAWLLENYCKPELRARFRPGGKNGGYAAYLASAEGSTLRDVYLVVRDVTPKQAEIWRRFLSDYRKALRGRDGIVCLIETKAAPERAVKGIRDVRYEDIVTPYDAFVFYLLLVDSAAVESYQRQYLAELAANLFGVDVEFGAACVREGKRFLDDPGSVLKIVAETQYRSDGQPFTTADLDQAAVQNAVWMTQVKMAFPLLERRRSKLLACHRTEIASRLPLTNNYGEEVTDYHEVEFGMLYHLNDIGELHLTQAEAAELYECREARNRLAHMKTLDFDAMNHLLAKYGE